MHRVRREKFTSPNVKDTNMLVFLAKELSFAIGDAKVPNANDFGVLVEYRLKYWNFGIFKINTSRIMLSVLPSESSLEKYEIF